MLVDIGRRVSLAVMAAFWIAFPFGASAERAQLATPDLKRVGASETLSIELAQAGRAHSPAKRAPQSADQDILADLTAIRDHVSSRDGRIAAGNGRYDYPYAFTNAVLSVATKEALAQRGDMLPDVHTTAILAARFLRHDQLVALLAPVDKDGYMKTKSKSNWKEIRDSVDFLLNRAIEFDRGSIIEKFRDHYMIHIAAASPNTPLDTVTIVKSEAVEYDFQRGGYNIDQISYIYLLGDFPSRSFASTKEQIVKISSDVARRLAQTYQDAFTIGIFGQLNGVELGDIRPFTISGKKTYSLFKGLELDINVTPTRGGVFTDAALGTEIGQLEVVGARALPPAPSGAVPRALLQLRSAPAAPPAHRPQADLAFNDRQAPKAALLASPASQPLLRIDGKAVIPPDHTVVRAVNWRRGLRGRDLDRAEEVGPSRHGEALIRHISALAYSDWLAKNPAMPTPPEVVAHFADRLLTQAQIDALYLGLTNRRFLPISAPKVAARDNFNIFQLMDPDSQAEWVKRFDDRHRRDASTFDGTRDYILLSTLNHLQYDFERNGIALNVPPIPSDQIEIPIKNYEPTIIGTSGLTIALNYTVPNYPNLMPISRQAAKNLMGRMWNNTGRATDSYAFDAVFGTIQTAMLSVTRSRLEITLDLSVERRALYLEPDLQTELIEATRSVALPPKEKPPAPSNLAPPPKAAAPPEQPNIPQMPLAKSPGAQDNKPAPEPAAKLESAPVKRQAEPPPPRRSPVVAEHPKAFKPDRTYDILGVHLGMSASEAEKLLRASSDFNRQLIVKPIDGNMMNAFAYAKVLIRNDSREYVALVTQPDRAGDKLVAIGRYSFVGLGVYKFDDFVASMTEKYGSIRESNGDFFHWGGLAGTGRTDGPCFVKLGTAGGIEWRREEDGKPPQWSEYRPAEAPAAFGGPKSMAWLGLKVSSLERIREFQPCGPTVAAWIPTVANQVGEFALWLTDTGVYIDIMANWMKGGGAARPRL